MVLEFGKYKIITDDKQFIVQEKKIKKEGQFTKEENVGQEYWSDQGYYGNLESALNSLPKRILLNNDDLKVIQKELRELQKTINEFKGLFELGK